MKLILEAIKSMFRSVRRKVDSALSVADSAQAAVDVKMNTDNPVGTGSFSMNRKTNTTIGGYSYTAGRGATASGNYSHASGRESIASGYDAFVHGELATASGDSSFAIGESATASGKCSTAIGQWVTAASKNQFVHGRFNITDNESKYLHIVGNGSSGFDYSNAHTLDWNGIGWFAGGLKVGGTGQDDANAKEVATKGDKLPNPNALTFTGAVEGTYDGSAPLTVEIPKIKEYTLPSASETALGGVKAPAKTEDMTQPVGIGEDGFLFTAPGASGDGDWETLVDFVAEEEVVEVNFQLQKGGCFSELVFLINTVLPGAFVENIDEYIYAVLGNTGGGDFTVGRLLHTFPTTNIANVYLADTSCFVRTMYARDSYSNKDYAVFSRTAPNKSTVIDTLTVFTQNWKNPFGVGTKIVILGKRV